jgi:Flp pilus assembly protein TadD
MSLDIGSGKIPAFFYKYKNALVCLLLLAAVLTAYHGSTDNGFVVFDDDPFIVHNRQLTNGLSWENVEWAFTTGFFGIWHPLTWLSLMLDYELYGLEPGGYHLTALILHSLNAIVLYFALLRLTGVAPPITQGVARPLRQEVAPPMTLGVAPRWGRCAAVALLFAVHPINVETVAWASERKGVLSSLFWMLTLWSYAKYAQRPSVGKYLPVMAFMSLGLMAKQMLVTLPLVLILLDYWPLGRLRTGRERVVDGEQTQPEQSRGQQSRGQQIGGERTRERQRPGAWIRLKNSGLPWLVVEKLPLFALSIMSGIVIFILQQNTGAVSSIASLSIRHRIFNALNSYILYIRKLFLPYDLAFFYAHLYIPPWRAALCALLLAAVTVAVFLSRGARNKKYLLTGWLWYIFTLIPVVGLVQIGSMSMADRYAYIPTVGLFVIAVWGAADLADGKPGRKAAALFCLAVLVISFTAYTRTQVRFWKNYVILYSHAAKVTKNNDVALLGVGSYLFKEGRYNDALLLFSEALKYHPGSAPIHYYTGMALLRLNRPGEAAYHLAAAINENLKKNSPEAETYNAMGIALMELGKPKDAVDFYKKAVELMPNFPESYNNIGIAYLKMNDLENSEKYFKKALEIQPGFSAARENLKMVKTNMAEGVRPQR